MSTADEIKKLNDLLKDRVITQEEFDLQKEKLLNSSTTTSTTDWLTLFLLTFFVGVLGVHRFYVGKIGTGFLMLLTLGGLGVWFLVDLILVVTGQFTNKDGQKIPRT
jgi:TM2 domain-containing membrane protein YozV|tara:strand:+ start:377 stop:697 length:321 start_codon:yes stop_codon:yes gene_type:complete